jgi:Na+-translocating ferredoxin:NAD+ oxidoreductase subunit A
MPSLLVILIGTVLVNTFLLMQDDAALGGSRQSGSIASAIRIGGASLATLLLAVAVAKILWLALPQLPADVVLLVYSLAVVAMALGLHQITRHRLPRLRRSMASSPIMMVANCLALGVLLLAPLAANSFASVLRYAAALGVGFVALLAVFVALTARIAEPEVPAIFRLAPITLISAGITALALMGFSGLLRG